MQISGLVNEIWEKLTPDGRNNVRDHNKPLKSVDLKEQSDPEAFTKHFLIERILDLLNLEILPEKQFYIWGKRRSVDYILKNPNDAKFLMEAKPINADLFAKGESGAVNQIKGLFQHAKAKEEHDFGIATDGLRWVFINKEGEVTDDLSVSKDFQRIKELLAGKKPIAKISEEEITEKFYSWYNALLHGGRYKDHKGIIKHISEKDSFVENIRSVERVEDREQIAQIIMDRLIFIKFLQSKAIIKTDVLRYISEYPEDMLVPKLRQLFFAVLNTEEEERLDLDKQFEGIPYLNGSLFNLTEIERKNTEFRIKAEILKDVINFLDSFKFVHREKEDADSIDPEILGYIFERAMTATDRKGTGAYYTPKSITKYISENTIYPCIIEKTNEILKTEKGYKDTELIKDIEELFILPATTLKEIWDRIILKLRVLDNACGSGAFLLAAANILFGLNKKINDKIGAENPDTTLKIIILVNNLYGVDINPNGIEIAKLRLWLWLADSYEPGYIKPLPNIDYNLRVGNSLIGYVDLGEFKGERLTLSDFLRDEEKPTLDLLLKERNDLIHEYKITWGEEAKELKESVQELDEKISNLLNAYLYRKFREKNIEINREEFLRLNPFHWGFEFYEVFALDKLQEERGFDVVIGNPPYVDIKGMNPKDVRILFNLFTTAENRINLYSLFIEASLSILNKKGYFGYINPNSILFNDSYKKIRERLLEKTNLRNIVRLPDDVFPGIKVETIIFIFKNIAEFTKKTDIIIYDIDARLDRVCYDNCKIHYFVNQSNWNDKDKRIFRIFSDEKTLPILKNIEKKSKTLVQLCDFTLGITPYDKYKGHTKEQIENKVFHSDYKKDETFKKLLSGADIVRYNISWNGKKWISYGDWLGAPREQFFFTNPRILIRQIVSGSPPRIYASYTNEEYYNTQIAFNIIVKDSSLIHEKVVLPLLNSKLMNFYHTEKFLDKSKRLFQKILILNTKLFPIKIPQNQTPFITLCDYMLLLNETEERRKAETDLIAFIDKQVIDSLVYELYFKDKFEEDGLKTNLLGLAEPYLKDIGDFKTEEEKLEVVKEVVERIKSDRAIKREIERIKNHEWVKVIEG